VIEKAAQIRGFPRGFFAVVATSGETCRETLFGAIHEMKNFVSRN
jgi:hypothetical protein